MPVPFEQTPTGTILVHEPEAVEEAVALYARVSSSDQKIDLDGQVARLLAYANQHGWRVAHAVTEIGSGLNGRRPKLVTLLMDPSVTTIIVEHRDRLARFGYEYVEAALAAQGRRLVVADPGEVKNARLYGRRSARNKARKALEAMEHAD